MVKTRLGGHYGRVTQEPELASLTDELYAGPPAEFVARRDELVKQARAAGDRALAARIRALRRPSVGAWYLNTAARAGLTSLRELLHLGEQLREAQAGGDFAGLRELAQSRGPLVSRVVRDLGAHLAQVGTVATAAGLEEVRATLASALAEPEVAEELQRGRLDRPHHYSGFGQLPVAPSTPAAEPSAVGEEPAATVGKDPAEPDAGAARAEREAAERELAAAEADLAAASADRAAAEERTNTARTRVETLADELARAREDLHDLEVELAAAAEAEQLSGRRVERARQQLAQPGSIDGA